VLLVFAALMMAAFVYLVGGKPGGPPEGVDGQKEDER
jgi:hypothetical protein